MVGQERNAARLHFEERVSADGSLVPGIAPAIIGFRLVAGASSRRIEVGVEVLLEAKLDAHPRHILAPGVGLAALPALGRVQRDLAAGQFDDAVQDEPAGVAIDALKRGDPILMADGADGVLPRLKELGEVESVEAWWSGKLRAGPK